jgi:hypothetical protein
VTCAALAVAAAGCSGNGTTSSPLSGDGGSSGSSGGDAGWSYYCESSDPTLCTCLANPGDSGPSTDTPCNATIVGQGGICCADPDYPNGPGACQCFPFGCNTSSVLCLCGNGTNGPRMCNGTFNICCKTDAYCDCDNYMTSCKSDETQVLACPDISSCPAGQVQVDACR